MKKSFTLFAFVLTVFGLHASLSYASVHFRQGEIVFAAETLSNDGSECATEDDAAADTHDEM